MFGKIRKELALKKAGILLKEYFENKAKEEDKDSYIFSYRIKVKVGMLNDGFSEREIKYALDFLFQRD